MRRETIKVLGVMTGTSCDGLDAACLEFHAQGWRSLWSFSAPYPKNLRKKVLEVQYPGSKLSIQEFLQLERELGIYFASTIQKAISKQSARERPDLIANHGQTIAHFPKIGMTLQLGEPTRIAAATGISVATHFRDGDLAAGGQGAPFVPLYHRLISHQLDPAGEGIAIHNIGGISNLTYIGPGDDPMILAFDTGPGNIWIDAAAELATGGRAKMDKGARLAYQGEVDEDALENILKTSYFSRKPPKSTGRDDFPFKKLREATRANGAHLVATATAITIESIARSYERFILSPKLPLGRIFLCGGGARNPALVSGIAARLPELEILNLGDHGFNPQFTEAEAFALFGFMSLYGIPLGGDWTGVKKFGPPAHLIPGENWQQLLRKAAAIS